MGVVHYGNMPSVNIPILYVNILKKFAGFQITTLFNVTNFSQYPTFPLGKGISGYVASTGIWVNVENAYEHPHFNPEIDTKTGYLTKTMLCMPICIRGSVIGVMQMVNKLDGSFTKTDEEAFEVFAVYCGLALHHAKLYDRIRRSEQKYRVALEVLAYHSVCNRDEVSKLKRGELSDRVPELETHCMQSICSRHFSAIHLLADIGFDVLKLVILMSMTDNALGCHERRKHQTMEIQPIPSSFKKPSFRSQISLEGNKSFWTIKVELLFVAEDDLNKMELALALYVSCLCHDLDHRGKNNAYMKTMSTPLASIYTTSVMEHHHFNQTVTILQQDGHNILRSMTSEQYKEALGLIKHCILATDLALFFTNKAELNKILDTGEYDIKIEHHRKLTQAILMTGCDLIASAKPWQIQTETVKVIFEEFYEQGDAERMNGREPIAMMDRNKAHELPQMQVGFMRGICMPCYDLIARIIPEASHLRDRCALSSKVLGHRHDCPTLPVGPPLSTMLLRNSITNLVRNVKKSSNALDVQVERDVTFHSYSSDFTMF
uniref:Phosphodiesterase n=1 Tax=Heterorhabditis bacteriophora TaxID=37862 RepID=A0A1I7WB41_HETBA